ncbi:helix-turn-helix domain-containing protein [Streptomyces sp. PA03-1a]|nr:helix-turn-helix domain-containing protein [Streptomyces sp. PA03-1a]MDX2816202.1 helix-turn-helix domain-containing protein [Streptomyces sp. PA03-5A]
MDSDPIYIRDRNVYTAAGITSALDLTLAFIEEDHGAELARRVARDLVTYLQRPGNQAQMSLFTASPPPRDDVVRQLVEHITSHPDHDLKVTALAARAGVTTRHLTRLFVEHLEQSPARFVRKARTEAAAHLLSSTVLPLAGVATRCGFGSTETLRQAFTSRYGVTSSFTAPLRRRPAGPPAGWIRNWTDQLGGTVTSDPTIDGGYERDRRTSTGGR